LEIKTVLVETRPMNESLQAMGKVFAHQMRKAVVSYPFPARLSRIHVRPGDWVTAGQPLVALQSEAVGEAKSAYLKAQADRELARTRQEREKRLFDQGAGAGKNLQAAEAEWKVALAALEAAEKKLHLLGFTEDQVRAAAGQHEISPDITLLAPISGKVMANMAVLGGMVDPSSEILTLLDPSLLCVDAEIYERDLSRLKLGLGVEVTVPAYTGLVFRGTLKYIGEVLNEETRTITVRTEVSNTGDKLKPGMFASVRILLGGDAEALVVPASAVLEEGDDRIVFVLRAGDYHPQPVRTGVRIDGHIEIREGLAKGDVIVSEGSFLLKGKLQDDALKGAHIH
jgi:cobalt-zinc-cadmium efflux system membrane fusion protein